MIIVTGANGFIGSALVRELNRTGSTDILAVDVISQRERSEPLQKAKMSSFQLTSDFLKSLPELKNVEAIFHMGAISSTTETNWDRLVENNIELSKTLFTFAAERKCPFIYASSGAVYGNGEKGFDDTVAPEELQPLNLYGKSKVEFDIWALKQKIAPPAWYGLRFFNVYGPNEYHKEEMCSMIYKAFLQVKASGSLKLFRSHNPRYADGEQLRDFVYIKDITRWMNEMAGKKSFASGIYNLGFGQARTWLDLARSVFRVMGVPENIQWIDMPASVKNQYQYFTEAKMEKAFQQGLSQPEYSLERGIEDYLSEYLMTADPYI